MAEYIDREAFLATKRKVYCADCSSRKNSKGKMVYDIGDAPCRACRVGDMLDDVENFPAADVVTRDCYDRILWENDVMRQQLADIGKAFAEKMDDVRPVVRGSWIGYPECLKYPNAYSDDHIVCSACEECFSILDNDCERFNFCPNCGAMMGNLSEEEHDNEQREYEAAVETVQHCEMYEPMYDSETGAM